MLTRFLLKGWPMWSLRIVGIALTVLLVATSTGTAFAKGISALQNLNQLLDHHHDHQALQKASTLLNLNRQALRKQGLNRYNLLRIRAESLLGLKLFSPAIRAYRAAANAAHNTSDGRVARATADLIAHSVAGYYVPPSRRPASLHSAARIAIFGAASRLRAMRAFSQDQWKTLQPRIAAAQKASGLDTTIRLFAALRIAVDVQTAAQPATTQHGAAIGQKMPAVAALDAISQRLVSRIQTACRAMQANINTINRLANSKITRIINRRRVMVRLGVTPVQADQLHNIIQTCRDIQVLASRFTRMFPDFPKECDLLKQLNDSALQIRRSAQSNLPR
ncbi:MAG: hypothetical protein ACYCZQ_15730 [Burkholderiales bacterium]